ncbi:magnesium transporter MRS2-4-like [Salvia splendens]|uniref:magnesium transporter MRS2-4-like n=1 Tax=Salvia splendens TaxID=180675 RepID=UPI001C2607BE|nr:magnesium transporter MRS2-4-like [Salvia splendens]
MAKLTFRRKKKSLPPTLPPPPPPSIEASSSTSKASAKKKPVGSRLWMRMDRLAQSELIDCDKTVIIKRVSIPAMDLRILGPIFSHFSSILDREKAMIVSLEFIRAIITAEEVLLLDPLQQGVLPFVDQLRQKLPQKVSQDKEMQSATVGEWLTAPETADGLQEELPFEFQVLEIALEVVCTYLDSSVTELERDAYPALDELAISVSTKNLERVRSLKSNLTRLLARVQKVKKLHTKYICTHTKVLIFWLDI